MIAELMESGGFTYYYRIEPMNLLASLSITRYIMYGLQAIFAFYIIIYLIKEARSFWKDRRRYFTYFWSWVDIQIIGMSLGSLAIYVLRIKEVNNLLTVFEESGGNAYTNFQSMAYWSEMLLYMLGLVLFWSTVKFIKLLRFNKMMSLLGSTLSHASEYLLSFAIIFCILFFAFVQYFYQTYFADFETFSTIVLTSEECLQMLVGKFNFSVSSCFIMSHLTGLVGFTPAWFFSTISQPSDNLMHVGDYLKIAWLYIKMV
jgi:polycystin 1L2